MNLRELKLGCLEKRYFQILNKCKIHEQTLYSSTVSTTREGGSDFFKRTNTQENCLPIRVPIERKTEIDLEPIVLDLIKKEKRHLYAEKFVKERYKKPIKRWR